jgi:hypothetical protein
MRPQVAMHTQQQPQRPWHGVLQETGGDAEKSHAKANHPQTVDALHEAHALACQRRLARLA